MPISSFPFNHQLIAEENNTSLTLAFKCHYTVQHTVTEVKTTEDVLPNINSTQAAKRAEKCRFLSLVTYDL